jgi:hypothetical protein
MKKVAYNTREDIKGTTNHFSNASIDRNKQTWTLRNGLAQDIIHFCKKATGNKVI